MTKKQSLQKITANLNNEMELVNQDILTFTAFLDENEIVNHIVFYAKKINKLEKYQKMIDEIGGLK